jgi:hypothetical protein
MEEPLPSNDKIEKRLSEAARKMRELAKPLPSGEERYSLMEKARQYETAASMFVWLDSPV